jgi:hypothetical protein
MKTEVVKSSPRELDGFDTIEGEDQPAHAGIIQGTLIKFGTSSLPTKWALPDGTQLSPQLELVPVNILRVVQKWPPGDNATNEPPETRILEPHEKVPDVEQLNVDCPRAEWRMRDGQPKGPFEFAYCVWLLDLRTMNRFTYIASTVGGQRAVRELRDHVTWMRKFRGSRLFPIVTLADVFMSTRFGGRQRPHFALTGRWITLGNGGSEVLLEKPAASTGGARTVEAPTAKEVTGDEIPF